MRSVIPEHRWFNVTLFELLPVAQHQRASETACICMVRQAGRERTGVFKPLNVFQPVALSSLFFWVRQVSICSRSSFLLKTLDIAKFKLETFQSHLLLQSKFKTVEKHLFWCNFSFNDMLIKTMTKYFCFNWIFYFVKTFGIFILHYNLRQT